jgi:hypothetical protein
MNEFTKEELEFIHKWLHWITKENYPLINKIKLMIEGYDSALECPTCGSKCRGEDE